MLRSRACLALCLALAATCGGARAQNASASVAPEGAPLAWFPWLDAANAFVTRLPEDKDVMVLRRDTSKDPARAPGLLNPQRYAVAQAFTQFPSLLGAPLAFTPADLKAAKVDVALVGLTVEDNPVPGPRYAANALRALRDWQAAGPSGTNDHTGVDWGSTLKIADYGNINSYFNQPERTLEEMHKVYMEILKAGAIPVAMGGTHVAAYAMLTALAQHYGPKQFAVLHIDAHYDAYLAGLGRYVHNGNFWKVAIQDTGLLKGSDLIQVPLRGHQPDPKALDWMRKFKLRYHTQAEVNKRGWNYVLKRILAELKGKKVYISWDMDGMDPAAAPAVGTQDPDGMTPAQAFDLLRGVGIQNEIVGADFLEYNPFMDDAHTTTGVLLDRLVRALMGGIASRRAGITDPFYIAPDRLDHGVRV